MGSAQRPAQSAPSETGVRRHQASEILLQLDSRFQSVKGWVVRRPALSRGASKLAGEVEVFHHSFDGRATPDRSRAMMRVVIDMYDYNEQTRHKHGTNQDPVGLAYERLQTLWAAPKPRLQ